jgi:hypothetical protein
MVKALALMASLAFAGAALAQQKWVDRDGKVHYGDTPPPGASVTRVRPPASAPASGADESEKAPLTPAEKEAEFRKRRIEAEKDRDKQAQASREAEEKRENCTRAQEALRTLETGRVAGVNAKGERYFLDDSQIEQEKARVRQAAQQWCS